MRWPTETDPGSVSAQPRSSIGKWAGTPTAGLALQVLGDAQDMPTTPTLACNSFVGHAPQDDVSRRLMFTNCLHLHVRIARNPCRGSLTWHTTEPLLSPIPNDRPHQLGQERKFIGRSAHWRGCAELLLNSIGRSTDTLVDPYGGKLTRCTLCCFWSCGIE